MRSLEEVFWSHVWRCTHPSPCHNCCWPWQGPTAKASKWHPSPLASDILRSPHRFALILAHGAGILPTADPHTWFIVCHRCDYPPCCNPAHLWLGTQGDNIRDAKEKGWSRTARQRQFVLLPDGTRLAA